MENKYVELSNGFMLPMLGFGTYKATEDSGEKVIIDALLSGYRYFDTASFYENESDIGNAIIKSGISRDNLILASKIWPTDLGYESALKAFEESINKLNTDYLDIYLIHWPKLSPDDKEWKIKLSDTWRAMEELYKSGTIKAIGLSNFLPHHIEVIKQNATVMPMLNQLELHVGYMQNVAVEYCRKNNIAVQAWSPLGRGRVLEDEIVVKMAKKYNKTVGQFLLGFLIQNDIAVIPKASKPDRMKENQNIFDFKISKEDKYSLLCLPEFGWSGEHPDFRS